jgi:hypothetical protein
MDMTEEEALRIIHGLPDGEAAVLYGELKRRLGWPGRTLVIGHGGGGIIDQTLDLGRYEPDVQRRVRDAADRLEPFLRAMEAA